MKVVAVTPAPPPTDQATAQWMRDEIERMISGGVAGVLISVEHHDKRISYATFPPLGGFLRGHITDLKRMVDDDESDE